MKRKRFPCHLIPSGTSSTVTVEWWIELDCCPYTVSLNDCSWCGDPEEGVDYEISIETWKRIEDWIAKNDSSVTVNADGDNIRA